MPPFGGVASVSDKSIKVTSRALKACYRKQLCHGRVRILLRSPLWGPWLPQTERRAHRNCCKGQGKPCANLNGLLPASPAETSQGKVVKKQCLLTIVPLSFNNEGT